MAAGRVTREDTEELVEHGRPRSRGRRLALDFAVELRRHGLAPVTVRRRPSTLSSLVGLAGELGAVKWSLEVPSEKQAAGAGKADQGGGNGDVAYFLPRHEVETDRLDVQHYALREHLGTNYLAPLEQPARILDVGCGTGLWAYELGDEFPDALVVGLDLAPSRWPWPDTYRFVRANVLQGLPFADDRFDFVHQRALISGVPVKSWQVVVQDLVRVAQPGGWVELVECPPWFESAGPVTEHVCGLLQQVVRARGLDSVGLVFQALDDHLRRAGLVDVGKRVVDLAVGEWGGRVGSLMATDCRALFMRLAPVFEAKFGIPEGECRELVAAMQQEWEDHRSTYSFAIAVGRKPV